MARPILQLKASKEEVAEPYHADSPFNFTDNDPEIWFNLRQPVLVVQ